MRVAVPPPLLLQQPVEVFTRPIHETGCKDCVRREFERLFITQRSARRPERECWLGAVFGVPQGAIIGPV